MKRIQGLHHITAISTNAQRTLDFYVGVLGLRLVKKTVNFDDPDTYHLYFGDTTGSPGTILTFFPWKSIPAGRVGRGMTRSVSFAVSKTSLAYWNDRLARLSIAFTPTDEMREEALAFTDPDGLHLRIVGVDDDIRLGHRSGAIPDEHVIRGFHSVMIDVERPDHSARVINDTLGTRTRFLENGVIRLESGAGGSGTYLDIASSADVSAAMGGGTVHHIAFAVASDADQLALRKQVQSARLAPTTVVDRRYFRSVYFREPGGVLFELATVEPGFAVDEPLDSLGLELKLPEWLEERRSIITKRLPELVHPDRIVRTPEAAITAHTAARHRGAGVAGGKNLESADGLMILLHGRGSTAQEISGITGSISGTRLAFAAPEATGNTWYPHPYAAPIAVNDPHRADALHVVREIVEHAAAKGIPMERVFILGFSQGACLALEYAAAHPGRYGGIFALSGALMGLSKDRGFRGDMQGTPVFISVSDPDPYIAVQDVKESAAVMTSMNADTVMRIYPNMGHRITADQLEEVNRVVCGSVNCTA